MKKGDAMRINARKREDTCDGGAREGNIVPFVAKRAKAVGRFLTFRVLSREMRALAKRVSLTTRIRAKCALRAHPPSRFCPVSFSHSSGGVKPRVFSRERGDFNKRNGGSATRSLRCILRLWPPINSRASPVDVARRWWLHDRWPLAAVMMMTTTTMMTVMHSTPARIARRNYDDAC